METAPTPEEVLQDNLEQIEAINKHKWILSEQAGYDVGYEAVRDWIQRFGAQWREMKQQRRANAGQ